MKTKNEWKKSNIKGEKGNKKINQEEEKEKERKYEDKPRRRKRERRKIWR